MRIHIICSLKVQRLFLAIALFVSISSVDSFGMAAFGKKTQPATTTTTITTPSVSIPTTTATATTPAASISTASTQSVGQQRAQLVGNMSLAREEKNQLKNVGIESRSLQEIGDHEGSDRFTPTEAYFQKQSLRDLVLDTFKDGFEPIYHMDIVSRYMAKEAEFRDTHWSFCHATSIEWTIPSDLFTLCYNHDHSLPQEDDFTFLRFNAQSGPQAKEFLMHELRKNGLVDDNGDARALLLSCNFSLFGNTGLPSESTWTYFMKKKSIRSLQGKFMKGY